MTVTAEDNLDTRITPAQRRCALDWLARECGAPDEVRDLAVRAWAHPTWAQHHRSCPCGHCVGSKWAEVLHDLGEARDLAAEGYPGEEWDAQARYDWGLDVLAYGERGRPAGKVHGARERVA